MEKQLGFYVNQQFCAGCKSCQVACKEKNDLDVGLLFRRVYEVEGGGFSQAGSLFRPNVFAYWISISCNHCTDPKCTQVCPTTAMHKNPEDGVVSVDTDVCIGCRYCQWACPYQAPQFNEKLGKMQKCDMCADYRAQGKNPACVDACIMRAIEWGPIDELKKKHPEAVSEFQGLPDQSMTRPNIIYTPHRHALKRESVRTEGR